MNFKGLTSVEPFFIHKIMKKIHKEITLYAYTSDTTLYDASEVGVAADVTKKLESLYYMKMVSRHELREGDVTIYIKDLTKQRYTALKATIEYARPFLLVGFKNVYHDLKTDTIYEFEIRDKEEILYKGNAIYTEKSLQVYNILELKKENIYTNEAR